MNNNVVSKVQIMKITRELMFQLYSYISIENKKNEVDELTETIILLYKKEIYEDDDSSDEDDIEIVDDENEEFSIFDLIREPSENIEDQLVLQQINPKTGEPIEGAETQFDATEIRSLACADADPFHPGRSVRITVTLCDGNSFRVKTAGRLAKAGKSS